MKEILELIMKENVAPEKKVAALTAISISHSSHKTKKELAKEMAKENTEMVKETTQMVKATTEMSKEVAKRNTEMSKGLLASIDYRD